MIEIEYNGGKITYSEANNKWHADLDGTRLTIQGRSSLAEARKLIDDIQGREKGTKEKPAFKRQPAYFFAWSEVSEVEVTSKAEDGSRYGSEGAYWVMKGGKRSKENESNLFDFSPANQALIEEWKGLQQAIEDRQTRQGEIKKKLTHFKA